jgi:TonB-dependent SusC/RagA subfamily outer membrane receptor
MLKIYSSLILVFFCSLSIAQNLTNSRRSSYYTFIYKIGNAEAETLYKDFKPSVSNSLLHTLVDFFPSDSSYKRKLPVGHYLFVKTEAELMECELQSINNLDLHILNNHRDLILVLSDSLGREVTDALVSTGKHKITYRPKTKSYHHSKSNRKGLVKVSYNGHDSFFELSRKYNNTFFPRVGRKMLSPFPIHQLIIAPFYYIKNNTRSLIKYGSVNPPHIYYRIKKLFEPKDFDGYVAFNKPIYKPGDTVKVKAFITTPKGKPVKKEVDVLLNSYSYGNARVKLGKISPTHPGAYPFEFVLHDSLKLKLDQRYSVLFDTKRQLLRSGSFKYEAYELRQNTFSLRADNKSEKLSAILYLKGTDSNGLPLFDVQTEIIVRPKAISQYYENKMYVSDTLWFHRMKLDPVGETRISIPDSVLPSLQFTYEAEVAFINSDNERHVKSIELRYNDKPFPFELKIEKDSAKIEWLVGMLPNHDSIRTQITTSLGTSYEKYHIVPCRELINSFTERVEIFYQGTHKTFDTRNFPSQVSVSAYRTRDSLFISLENPRNLAVRYFLFKNQKQIRSGEEKTLSLKSHSNSNDHYSLSVQYIWAGESETEEYDIPFNKKQLQIALAHDPMIYPGQTADFTVSVHDAFGNPVENTDLTAYAITKKFKEQNSSDVPDFHKTPKGRKVFNEFSTRELPTETSQQLEWHYWRKTLGLDSLTYYHFLYPDSGRFDYRLPGEEGISQFAPFVVDNGEVLPVHIVYIDNVPVYARQAESIEPYSFYTYPGKHRIALRIFNKLITLNDVEIKKGEKLIFSIDNNKLPLHAWSDEKPNLLTLEEKKNLSRYFLLVDRTSLQNTAYFQQGDQYHLLNNTNRNYYTRDAELVGPFIPQEMKFVVRNQYTVSTTYEPFYQYEFKEGLVKMHDAYIQNSFWSVLSREKISPNFKDQVQTQKRIEKYWKTLDETEQLTFHRFPDYSYNAGKKGRLKIEAPVTSMEKLRATFIINLDNPDDYTILPGSFQLDMKLQAGHYQVVFIFNNDEYFRADSIFIKPHGLNYYNHRKATLHASDSFSREIMTVVRRWAVTTNYVEQVRQKEMQTIRELYYSESGSSYYPSFTHTISGQILDETGLPAPGINVMVKGSTVGTVTDADGYYNIQCAENSVIVFSFIGYMTHEIAVDGKSTINSQLTADVTELSEVVVVGYGSQKKMSLAYSVSTTLQGRAAGVQVRLRGSPGLADSIDVKIRGISTLKGESSPIVVIDGKICRLEDISPDAITAIEILKGDEATAIYGSRAASGVILISTKQGITKSQLLSTRIPGMSPTLPQENTPGSSLRKNFRDYAFWKPALRTDEKGEASFSVTFPDDITGWNAYVLGMASHKRTGETSSTIQSYKPLAAQLSLPNFLINGDSSIAIGKLTNYSQESVHVIRSAKIQNTSPDTSTFKLKDSHIDSIFLRPTTIDSLAVKYTVRYKNYEDGELRKIPVYPVGTQEAVGTFLALPRDTSLTLNFNSANGKVKIYAQADLLDVILDEVNYLKQYPYECNEQLASRLIALLIEKQILDFRKEKNKEGKSIEKLIKKITSHQTKNGGWSWWGNDENQMSLWISLHVVRALHLAEREKLNVVFDREGFINYLETELHRANTDNRISILQYLNEHGQKIPVATLTDSIAKSDQFSFYQKLRAQKLRQASGLEVAWKYIRREQKETLKGNIYWGEDRANLFNNDILNTLTVYQLKEKANQSDPDLLRMRNFFLEKRTRRWRNTFESSLLLETLLPALLRESSGNQKTQLEISGALSRRIDTFPFETSIDGGSITLSKKGSSPIYFTAYQEIWNADPKPVEKDFVIKTSFVDAKQKLKAGKPVTLIVDVQVKKDAEYAMIEVPIPAGCSYESKSRGYGQGEVYREYFPNKTTIYSESLRAGNYQYTIKLVPRYSGKYTLNPAKIEWMYFPVIFGRNEIKKIIIQ